MAKFPIVDGGERGRPTVNKKDESGRVRIVMTLAGSKGNICKSLTLQGKVSEVFAAIRSSVASAPVKEKKAAKKAAQKIARKSSK